MKRAIHFFTLLSSSGTLICCALPALLVTLGFGATFAGLITNVPQLIWFSENKVLVFSFGGLMLLVSGALRQKAAQLSCPTDPNLRAACQETRGWSDRLFWVSVAIYLLGFSFAFLAPLMGGA